MFFTPVIRRSAYGPALRAVDRGFERFVNEAIVSPAAQLRARAATADQNDTHWTLQIDVPGLSREQLSVAIEGAVVRIESIQDAPRAFKAAYELPQEIDTATSSAKQENGVLTLTLGKQQPVSNVTQLPIA